jgi:hypothetical protein
VLVQLSWLDLLKERYLRISQSGMNSSGTDSGPVWSTRCECGGYNTRCYRCEGSGSRRIRTRSEVEQEARQAHERIRERDAVSDAVRVKQWNIEHGWKFEQTARRDLHVRLVTALARRRDFLELMESEREGGSQ